MALVLLKLLNLLLLKLLIVVGYYVLWRVLVLFKLLNILLLKLLNLFLLNLLIVVGYIMCSKEL